MKKRQMILLVWAALLTLQSEVSAALASELPSIIPLPQKIKLHKGDFVVHDRTRIVCDEHSKEAATSLANRLRIATGYPIAICAASKSHGGSNDEIRLTVSSALVRDKEGYKLIVSPGHVEITGADPAGVFYGTQTFEQLLPPSVFGNNVVIGVKWSVPCVSIADAPRFAWRGLMLDVSRHFFDKSEIETLLDEMALHKMNVFHWHLVDDQGWRIEIKKFPLLTQTGAWRKGIGFHLDANESHAYGADGRYGGYYSHDDIREIVAYAAKRNIMVIPEIEMPGHSCAALAAYPQLSCTGARFSTDSNGGVFAGVFCAGKDESFEFLQSVLAELFDLFPAPYVHIGGDEVPKDNWRECSKCQARIKAENLNDEHDLQSYFVRRMQKFINDHGKTMIGWTEIADGGLPPGAVLMDWKGGAVEAARAGHIVIMARNKHCYFDYCQSSDKSSEPSSQPDVLPLAQVYAFKPIPSQLNSAAAKNIGGVEGALWTEYIPNVQKLQYMAFPRLAALSEVAWSDEKKRRFSEFISRLDVHSRRLDELGINYRKASLLER